MKSLFHLFFLASASLAGAVALADGRAASPVEPECVSSVYPHRAMSNDDGECGIVHVNGRKGDVLAAYDRLDRR